MYGNDGKEEKRTTEVHPNRAINENKVGKEWEKEKIRQKCTRNKWG